VLVVGFVGAFLSLCQQQLPPFSRRWADFRARGIDAIVGVSVNDHAVLKSFAQQADVDLNRVSLIADHDGSFVRACNLALDLSAAGMGLRARRFAMLVREGFVEEAWVEPNPGELTVASAEAVLERMPIIVEPSAKKKDKAAPTTGATAAQTSEATSDAAGSSGSVSAVGAAAASTAAQVVAAVQRTVAAVSDRLEGHGHSSSSTSAPDGSSSHATAKEGKESGKSSGDKPSTQSSTNASNNADAPTSSPLSDSEREAAAAAAVERELPPGQ